MNNILTETKYKNDVYLDRFLKYQEEVVEIYEAEETEIILGCGSKIEDDLFLDECQKDLLPIHRRRGGGGTVLLSPGMIIIVIVTKVKSLFNNQAYFRAINRFIVNSLKCQSSATNDRIKENGISDLTINNKKIFGSSIYRRKNILFFQGSLMVTNDLNLISKYLKLPKLMPAYRMKRSHKEFCTNFIESGYDVDTHQIIESLKENLQWLLFE